MVAKKKIKAAPPEDKSLLLRDWKKFAYAVKDMTEEECNALLEVEKKGYRRIPYLVRLYGRMNLLRTKRERDELIRFALKG